MIGSNLALWSIGKPRPQLLAQHVLRLWSSSFRTGPAAGAPAPSTRCCTFADAAPRHDQPELPYRRRQHRTTPLAQGGAQHSALDQLPARRHLPSGVVPLPARRRAMISLTCPYRRRQYRTAPLAQGSAQHSALVQLPARRLLPPGVLHPCRHWANCLNINDAIKPSKLVIYFLTEIIF